MPAAGTEVEVARTPAGEGRDTKMMSFAAIILAAGRSLRMGRVKQLLPVAGKPAVRMCVERLRAAGVADIVVVIRPEGEAIAREVEDLSVRVAVNTIENAEMADSLRVGVPILPPESHAFVLPCDCPLVRPDTIRALAAAASPSAIVVPRYSGRSGHPVLLPVPVLRGIDTAPTLRHLIESRRDSVIHVDVDDSGIRFDMDRPEDYLRILRMSDEAFRRV